MNPLQQNLQNFLQAILKLLQNFAQKPRVVIPAPVQPVPIPTPPPSIEIEFQPEPTPAPTPTTNQFLICPIQANDASGNPVTARTVKISAVTDHLGTAIDPASTKHWGIKAKDYKVKAFNGEIGDGEASSGPPYGYAKKTFEPFFSAGEINYVGAPGGEAHGPKYYLQYDGHAGYDFAYKEMTPVLATADGELHKAKDAEDTAYGQGWNAHHTFYIKHQNGMSSWYRHCVKLTDEIEALIGNDFSKVCHVTQGQPIAYVGSVGFPGSVHLHFEVHDAQGRIVDPYEEAFWK